MKSTVKHNILTYVSILFYSFFPLITVLKDPLFIEALNELGQIVEIQFESFMVFIYMVVLLNTFVSYIILKNILIVIFKYNHLLVEQNKIKKLTLIMITIPPLIFESIYYLFSSDLSSVLYKLGPCLVANLIFLVFFTKLKSHNLDTKFYITNIIFVLFYCGIPVVLQIYLFMYT